MARILQSIRKCKASLSSFSSSTNSSTDELIRKRNKKSNKIRKNKIKKNKFTKKKNDDVMVYIPYCADQINELKKKVTESMNEEKIPNKMPFLMDFEDENGGFKSAFKDGANDCFLLENVSFEFDVDVRNMVL